MLLLQYIHFTTCIFPINSFKYKTYASTHDGYFSMNEKLKASVQKNSSKFRIWMNIIYILSILVIFLIVIDGFTYYTTPLVERPRHVDYRSLKPGGLIGHGYGIWGSLFILLSYVYSIRKRWKPLKKIGSIPQWLEIHIFLGLMGPILIIFHSTFKINGLVAIAFWAMMAIVASGFVGRFIIRQIPRDIKGHKSSLEELNAERDTLHLQLIENYGLSSDQIEEIELLASPKQSKHGLSAIIKQNISDFTSYFKIKRFLKMKDFDKQTYNLIALRHLAYQDAILNRRIAFLKSSLNIFKQWHRIHKPFSYIMLIIMFIHIGISIWLGYRWIF